MSASISPDDFERLAAERVASLVGPPDGPRDSTARDGTDGGTIDIDTFAAMFDLFRVSARVVADLEATVHRPAGLSTAGFRVLFTVWVFGSLEPREIARLAGVSTAAVSGVLGTLERNGHVAKTRRGNDRRRLDVTLTDSGEELVTATYRTQNRRERVVFDGIDVDELRAFTRTLRRILAAPLAPSDAD
ncbi:MAG: MarR family transcriptional regulator, partial [Actinomycetota bacterium]